MISDDANENHGSESEPPLHPGDEPVKPTPGPKELAAKDAIEPEEAVRRLEEQEISQSKAISTATRPVVIGQRAGPHQGDNRTGIPGWVGVAFGLILLVLLIVVGVMLVQISNQSGEQQQGIDEIQAGLETIEARSRDQGAQIVTLQANETAVQAAVATLNAGDEAISGAVAAVETEIRNVQTQMPPPLPTAALSRNSGDCSGRILTGPTAEVWRTVDHASANSTPEQQLPRDEEVIILRELRRGGPVLYEIRYRNPAAPSRELTGFILRGDVRVLGDCRVRGSHDEGGPHDD